MAGMMRYSTFSYALVAAVFGAGTLAGCGGCEAKASVQGRVASAEGFGQAQSALEQALGKESGLGRQTQALTLEGISVYLFERIEDIEELHDLIEAGAEHVADMGDGQWIFVDSREPESDGSFSFPELTPGHYSLQLDQPEFGGVAYGVDGTDFHLEAGQTVSLILPLVSTFEINAPGLVTGEREYGDNSEYRSPDGAIIDEESGLIIGGGDGLWVLDPDSETIHSLFSSSLFGSEPEGYHLVAYSPGLNEVFFVFANRIVAVDLAVFDDVEPGQALDYDDPEVRLAIGDKVRWRLIGEDMTERMSALRWGPVNRRNALGWFFSEDESLLYVTVTNEIHDDQSRVMVMETDTLSVRRLIFGEVIAYNAYVDQLVLRTDNRIALVDASAMRDVAEVGMLSDLGVAPVPESGKYYVAHVEFAADDTPVPFIAVVDEEGEIISYHRASDLLGMDYDPDPGAPWFDSTGEYFMLGTQGFRVLDDGGFEYLGLTVPLSESFENRVECNAQRVFDPVNRYEIWFDYEDCYDLVGVMAIISTDRGNIPISIRVNSANVLLHPPSGRAFVFDDHINVSVVHYADPMAAERPSFTRIVTGEEHLEPGQECSADERCPFEQICLQRTDTAWTGNCMENVRSPFLRFCGGLTGIECDDGFTCELSNPTNPDSLGVCMGCPERDYENHGPRCGPDGECIAGFSCNEGGRCVPQACMNDADCGDGEVCGMVRDVGRACMTPGPLESGEICYAPDECQSGVCMDPHLESGPSGFCTTSCAQNADCPDDFLCQHFTTPWPICVHEEWALSGYRAHDHCSDCAEDAICSDRGGDDCQVGFFPGPLTCSIGIECSSDLECALPGSCVHLKILRSDEQLYDDERICGFPCSQNADCPWDADCINGTCSVTRQYENDRGYFCEDGQGCPDDQWCLGLQFPSDPFHCTDEQPCDHDSECEDGLECFGICSHGCGTDWDAAPNECGEGLQCVYDGDSFFGPICMPPACDCPDTGGPTPNCRLDTRDCSFRQNCALALCDGTYGPPDPNDPEERTCCRPGNPCGLSQEDLCKCPPTCDFWTQAYCCHYGDVCPGAANPASLCPDGYECRLLDYDDSIHQAYGFLCVGTD